MMPGTAQDRDARRMTREVELEFASRLDKRVEVDEEFEDWYG
jgi:hypothetical protein